MGPVGSVGGPPRALFDRLAPIYDRTRGPLDDVSADGLAGVLLARGAKRILEIGVGTGRVAGPLVDRGLEVTGIDTSSRMMAEAARKGVHRLVTGTVYRLPFGSRSFDGVLLAHVLHLLEDPALALAESLRVSRDGVSALLTLRDEPAGPPTAPREDDLRAALHDLLAAQGVDLPPFRPPWRQERELLQRLPPSETVPISDRTVTEPAEERIQALELRAYRNLLDVPPEPMARAIAALRAAYGGRELTRRRIYGLARWDHAPAPQGG